MKNGNKKTIQLCVTAMFAALLVGGKEALAVVPNVEIVTIVIAVCAYTWGLAVVLPAVFVFVAVDVAIWGINTWVVSYLIHWNVVAVCFWLLGKVRFRNKALCVVVADIAAVVLTVAFGVLTSFVDVIIGYADGFFWDLESILPRFAVMYTAGVPFFVTQIVCNAALFAVGFWPLVRLNEKAKLRLFAPNEAEDPGTSESAAPAPSDAAENKTDCDGQNSDNM